MAPVWKYAVREGGHIVVHVVQLGFLLRLSP